MGQKRELIISGWETLSQLSGERGGVASLPQPPPLPRELLEWELRIAALSPSVSCLSLWSTLCLPVCVPSQLDLVFKVEDASAELVGGAHGTHRAATRTLAPEKR